MKQVALLNRCGSNNAGTGEQNPTPTLLIVIILFSSHSMTDCHPRKLEVSDSFQFHLAYDLSQLSCE